MNQQPDKFFRDKLQSFQTPAPAGAWNRIEANLDKKNNKILWFRIAASLLLVAIATYLLWPSGSITTTQPELAEKTKTEKSVTPAVKEKEEQVAPVTAAEDNKIALQQKKIANPQGKSSQQKSRQQNQKPAVKHDAIDLSENNISVAEATVEKTQEIITSPAETQTTVIASAETQKVKIIFSAEDVDNKYLDKKALAEATSDDKKPSTLKKLLDKAYDLKYNQDPFGDLRQKKDEILALNFRKDKRSDN